MSDERRLEPVRLPVKSRRSQSTIAFPYYDLACSQNLARQTLEAGGECRPEQLAAWLGHSTLNSGAYRNKVAAAGLFGLVRATRNNVSVTPAGKAITQDHLKRQAKVDAFLNVAVYRAIFDRYRGTRLPPSIALERELIDQGVTRTQARYARQVLLRSAEQAGLFEASESKMVIPRGAHLAGATPPPELQDPGARQAHPRLIDAILQEAPWNESWSREQFEQWASLFVMAARVHFGLGSED